jgi:hypothetical protein
MFLQAWVTLGRAQLNFGEPDSAILSFDKALAIKVLPFWCCVEIAVSASLAIICEPPFLPNSSGLSTNKRRFTVGENSDKGAEGEEKADETAVQSG